MRIILIILDQVDFFIGNSVAIIGVTGGIFSLLQDRHCLISFCLNKKCYEKIALEHEFEIYFIPRRRRVFAKEWWRCINLLKYLLA
jgi:hypothetical protein